MIDLHTHSTASDGTFSPSELIAAAGDANLRAVALTDHDTMDGLAEFMAAGDNSAVKSVPGVEIACSWYGYSLHLTGLFVDCNSPVLQEMLAEIRVAREQRNQKILQRLQDQGISLTMADVEAESSQKRAEVIGRPHFARALVKGEHCENSRQAFNRFLGRHACAYVSRFLPLPAAAIHAIHEAGGVAVLAHPFGGTKTLPRTRTRQKLQRLIRFGLDGIEVYYCDYTERQEKAAFDLASELELLPSGGSDFHGDNIPGIQLGRGYGGLATPDRLLLPLQQRAEMWRRRLSQKDS